MDPTTSHFPTNFLVQKDQESVIYHLNIAKEYSQNDSKTAMVVSRFHGSVAVIHAWADVFGYPVGSLKRFAWDLITINFKEIQADFVDTIYSIGRGIRALACA